MPTVRKRVAPERVGVSGDTWRSSHSEKGVMGPIASTFENPGSWAMRSCKRTREQDKRPEPYLPDQKELDNGPEKRGTRA